MKEIRKRSLPLVVADKTMLPELLPDPRRASGRSEGPRARTMAHLQRLVATAATVGVAVGCGKEPKGPDPTPPQTKDGPTDVPVATVSATATATANPNATDTATPPMGYAVVDPMPSPAYCPGIAKAIAIVASFEADGTLVVRFPAATGRPDFHYVIDADPIVYTGTLASKDVKRDVVVAKVTTQPNTNSAMVAVKGFCDKGAVTIDASVTWSGKPGPRVKPTVTKNEY